MSTRLQWVKVVFKPLLARGFFHLGVLGIIAFSLAWARLDLARFSLDIEFAHPDSTVAPAVTRQASAPLSMRGLRHQVTMRTNASEPEQAPVRVTFVQNLLHTSVPHTIIPERLRREVITYVVAPEDNVLRIAERFGLRPDTLIWANHELEKTPDLLSIGQELVILPVDGVYHTVEQDETLASIADRYGVSVEAIIACPYNNLKPDEYGITPGQQVIVPGGVKTFDARYIRSFAGTAPSGAARGAGNFVWPTGGYISQGYWDLHRAIDIAGTHGDGVVASDAGFVAYASWDSHGYGNLVVIDHGNGFVTYYAHLYGFYVDKGDSVQRGQLVGARGTTGRSTGSHLHFEIHYDNVLRNPLAFLPGQ